MNVFTTDKIRNVVMLGHGGCGKTTLTEAMAALSGAVPRAGKVEDGNMARKRSRDISPSLRLLCRWSGKIIRLTSWILQDFLILREKWMRP